MSTEAAVKGSSLTAKLFMKIVPSEPTGIKLFFTGMFVLTRTLDDIKKPFIDTLTKVILDGVVFHVCVVPLQPAAGLRSPAAVPAWFAKVNKGAAANTIIGFDRFSARTRHGNIEVSVPYLAVAVADSPAALAKTTV
eukprot:9490292-Pyramimonas_sp.AAC.1